ncbi:hypothetical protein [Clostridium tarantellae]|uniref:Uncharacterized protein n=1 Tax=Clostridium tarantellae TaxID=39493 RepID=A0A6I1MN53_9CLOT|nr:hypothetical protein [Clostridium tarantellae]MPQ44454.1 hypothetical protein [Clostridium tarantellae]
MGEWNPIWTDEVKIENGGRYPLLLNRFHDHMEEILIKGIVSTTQRLRYISYCVWAIGDIEESMDCNTYSEFVRAFRVRESALAVGLLLLSPETKLGNYNIYGVDTMSSIVNDVDKAYDCEFKVLSSQELGAFGQYYKGTIQNCGLIYVNEEGVVKLTPTGQELYKIMVNTYKNSKYYNLYKGKKNIPGQILKEWASVNEYDNITDALHKAEREFYKRILFHLETKYVSDFRRDTLTIYLECIRECNKHSLEFNEHIIRNSLYYKRIETENEIIKFEMSSFLDDAVFYWSIYETQVYFRWWISEYLRYFLKSLSSESDGMTVDEVIENIDQDIFNAKIRKLTDIDKNYFILTFKELSNCIEKINDLGKYLLEDDLSYEEIENISHFSADLLSILVLLYEKYKELKKDKRYIDVSLKLIDDYWFDEFFREIDSINKYKVPDLLRIILNRYVIQKHDNAMYAKNDLRRCWFTRSGDKYQFQSNSSSIWRPAKHRIICNFLFDMGLIAVDDEIYVMTEEGNIFYKELREKIYNYE